MSKLRDIEAKLKENGFRFHKQGKHKQFTDGVTLLIIPTGSGFHWRMEKWINCQIKRAVKKRNEVNGVTA